MNNLKKIIDVINGKMIGRIPLNALSIMASSSLSDQIEARNEVVAAKLEELSKQNASLRGKVNEMEKNTNKVSSVCYLASDVSVKQ